jgi:hypothetical protein
MALLSEVLRSGKYGQLVGKLFRGADDEFEPGAKPKGCCLGVMECELGMKFTLDSNMEWIDPFGMDTMPSTKVLEPTGLANNLTELEIIKLHELAVDDLTDDMYDGDYIRANVLASINDAEQGGDFDFIAKVLILMDWDFDLDAVRAELEKDDKFAFLREDG